MARNEFGVESSDSGGFGAGVGSDFEAMFAEATEASVVDDEVSQPRSGRRSSRQEQPTPPSYFDEPTPTSAPVSPVEPEFVPEPEPEPASFGFGGSNDIDAMFAEAENASVADDEIREPVAPEAAPSFDSFESFGSDSQGGFESFGTGELEQPATADNFENWVDPAIEAEYAEYQGSSAPSVPEVAPQPSFVQEPSFTQEPEPVRTVEPAVTYTPSPVDPVPSVPAPQPVAPTAPAVQQPRQAEPVRQAPVAQAPVPTNKISEGDVDYIERVILTSDAIRELPEDDAKAVNMFITAGQPVESHQELVLTALLADRQILKTAEAILEAKAKSSVDRAFHILGLDDTTFVDFGKILSHDLEATETVLFEGDRLQYARKLVDVVEALPQVSIERFKAVKSVLGAGELEG